LESKALELNVDVGDSNTLLARLKGFHLDAILCDVPYPHSEDEPLIQREIAREIFCLVSKVKKKNHSLADIIKDQGIYLPAKSNPATAEIEAFLIKQKIKAPVKGYIDDIALLRLLALETEAIVAIPRIGAERELESKTLFVVHELRSLYQRFYLVLRQRGQRSDRILALLKQ